MIEEKQEEETMAFLDRVLGKDEKERKLQQEIHSLELRKESVCSAIDGEIARLQGERNNVFLNAGVTAYETWNSSREQADLTSFWEKIKQLDGLIAEQEHKKTEMGDKYDEEIRLISSNLNTGSGNNAGAAANMGAPTNGAKKCPACGGTVGDADVFCQVCGAKLQ